MKLHSFLSQAVITLALVFGSGALRADILINENFAQGKVHWKGDVQDLPAPLGQNPPPGAMVKLKKDSWTRIFQVFKAPAKGADYTITYQLSPDFKMVAKGISTLRFPEMTWGQLSEDKWLFAVNQGGGGSGYPLTPSTNLGVPVTIKGGLPLYSGRTGDAMVSISFPPGEGSITFTDFTVTAK